jgi:peptidoglycan/LPS O-acetylase OafA/YrhL
MQPEPARFYLPQIDGLRVVAVALIFVHHNQPDNFLGLFGWIGVDLADVISSFLLTTLLIKEQQKVGAIDVRRFYVRRFLRVAPLYYFFILAMLAIFAASIVFDRSFIVRLFAQFTFTDNLVSAIRGGWNQTPFSLHLWVISFEMQVYLLLPFIVRALRNLTNTQRVMVMACVLVCSLIGRAVVMRAGYQHPTIYLVHVLRPEPIIAGMLVAYFTGSMGVSRRAATLAAAVAAACALALYAAYRAGYAVFIYDEFQYVVYGLAACMFGSIIVVLLGPQWWGVQFFQSRPMRYFGRLSYGMYVYNIAGIVAARTLIERGDPSLRWASVALAVVLIVAASALSYRFIELPFLRRKERYARVLSKPV